MTNSQELKKIADEISEIGKLIKQKKNFKLAENKARKLYSQYSNNVSVLNTLGIVLAHNSHLDESVTVLKKAIKLNPKDYSTYFNLSKTYEKYKKKIDQPKGDGDDFFLNLIIPLKQEQRFQCLMKTIEFKPDFVQAHLDLGTIYLNEDKLDLALSSLTNANEILPNAETFFKLGLVYSKKNNLIKAFENLREAVRGNLSNDYWSDIFFSIINKMSTIPAAYFDENLEKIIEYSLVNQKNLNSLMLLSSHFILFSLKDLNTNFDSIVDEKLQLYKILNSTLLNLHLKYCKIANIELEEILIKLRCSLLKRKINNKNPLYNKTLDFFLSLAFHAFNNEYLWDFSIEEKKILDDKILGVNLNLSKDVRPDDIELYTIAAYYPLRDFPNIREWLLKNYSNFSENLKKIIQEQIIAFDQELEIAKNIKQVGKISDPISTKVKQQYEEYPYPRWTILPNIRKLFKKYNVIIEMAPNVWENILDSKDLKLVDVLIAGCGTGQHALINAKMDNTLKITSLDLSKKSLSYAIKKCQEYDFKNVEFYQADILNLAKLDKEFDLIECVGVLHHMHEPEQGLKSLLHKLKTKGLIKIGLYSKFARRHITKIRQIIKEKGFKNSLTDIRELRSYFYKNCPLELKKIFNSRDYYSSSNARDLMFHVQEHQFTIPEIDLIVKKNNLKFLGFNTSKDLKNKYLKEFPKDKYCTNLVNWHIFEKKHPNTFRAMYQFWCQKIS